MSKNKFLVMSRVGDQSLHQEWIHPAKDKNFDLFLEYFGDNKDAFRGDCQYYSYCKTGGMYPRMYDIIKNNPYILSEYDAIWITCDDISTNATNINKMFDVFMKHNLWLAQPALTRDSYYSHGITFENSENTLRYTSFVEVMAPIFSSDALSICLSTFEKSPSGWGLDLIWPKVLGDPEDKVAIIDQTPVKHTRPVGGGSLYKDSNVSPQHDLLRIWDEYKLIDPFRFKTYGVIKK